MMFRKGEQATAGIPPFYSRGSPPDRACKRVATCRHDGCRRGEKEERRGLRTRTLCEAPKIGPRRSVCPPSGSHTLWNRAATIFQRHSCPTDASSWRAPKRQRTRVLHRLDRRPRHGNQPHRRPKRRSDPTVGRLQSTAHESLRCTTGRQKSLSSSRRLLNQFLPIPEKMADDA
jgi:hypothetical protein